MVDLDKIPQPTALPDPITLSSFTWKSYQVKTPDTTFPPQITALLIDDQEMETDRYGM